MFNLSSITCFVIHHVQHNQGLLCSVPHCPTHLLTLTHALNYTVCSSNELGPANHLRNKKNPPTCVL